MRFFRRKKVPASELFGQFQATRNNIPPENMSDGISKRARMMNDPMYSAKYYRKKFGDSNKYDLAEDKLEQMTKYIIYQIYNYPFKILPVIHKEKELQEAFEKFYVLLSELVNSTEQFKLEKKENIPYMQYLDYAYSDVLLSYLNNSIEFLENKEEMQILLKAIEMDNFVLSKVTSALERIKSLNNLDEYHIEERIDFHGYKKS